MSQVPVKYIQVDYWNYWWCVYSTGKEFSPPHWVECSLSDDVSGEVPFFHFDLYNLHELRHMLREQEFIQPDRPDYPIFLRQAESLERGETDFFIGALYYRDFTPDLAFCNRPLPSGKTLLDRTSQPLPPHYAVLFLAEEQPLTPEILTQWLTHLARPLFGQDFSCLLPRVPTREESAASWQSEQL